MIVLLLLRIVGCAPTERHKLAKGDLRETGKVVFSNLKICSGWIETSRSLRGEIHPGRFCKILNLSQRSKLLQLWSGNIRKVQEKEN